MALKIGSTSFGDFKIGSTQLSKICLGTVVLWENWKTVTGSLIKKTFGYTTTREGLVYDSGKVSIGKTVKISQFRLFSYVYRDDNGGRISGRFEIYGYKADGTSVLLLDRVAATATEWNTQFIVSISNANEFTDIQYKFYVYDTIWRTYHTTMWAEIYKWDQKGS